MKRLGHTERGARESARTHETAQEVYSAKVRGKRGKCRGVQVMCSAVQCKEGRKPGAGPGLICESSRLTLPPVLGPTVRRGSDRSLRLPSVGGLMAMPGAVPLEFRFSALIVLSLGFRLICQTLLIGLHKFACRPVFVFLVSSLLASLPPHCVFPLD